MLPQTDGNSTLAIALGLIALSLGLRYPSDLSVSGHLTAGGIVKRVIRFTPAVLSAARRLGIQMVVLCSQEADDIKAEAAAAAGEEAQEQAEVRSM